MTITKMARKHSLTWKPCPIEYWFREYPDVLILWNFFDFVEEKRPPIYADEPIARSKKFPENELVSKLNRSSFRPHQNFNQLRLIAELSGLTELSIDINVAFGEVVEWIKELNETDN